jgi:hypothetical protein
VICQWLARQENLQHSNVSIPIGERPQL